MIHCSNKRFDFISLLFRYVSETNKINCQGVFFHFFTQNSEGLNILCNGRANKAYHSLFLCLIGSVFQSKSSNLKCLYLCKKLLEWSEGLHELCSRRGMNLLWQNRMSLCREFILVFHPSSRVRLRTAYWLIIWPGWGERQHQLDLPIW